MAKPPQNVYRGRLAPSPTGFLHLGHARTFWVAWQRARAAQGKLVFRNEDLDYQRCKLEFVRAMYEDLRWLGLDWDEGLDLDSGVSHGSFGPYSQSERHAFYVDAWRKLRDRGFIYPCTCSRKDLDRAISAPHEPLHGGALSGSEVTGEAQPATDDELPYPGTCRKKLGTAKDYDSPATVSWRFKVPDGETVSFEDGYFGRQEFVAGRDFADFLLWRRDDIPAYQLAVVADDAAMQITEVVRGADLLKSTARQLLLIRALEYPVPAYFHCPLLRDEKNIRLAKRHDALSLRKLREQGIDPEALRKQFAEEMKSARVKK
ncbi:MAG TPA: tRNA glutamyl-Q(34) synthetase GluQRS [Candidatus Angelobacter sp.]|nr:tRNA glutamyl-Q(34) synthetase GluQRS [Candidatus Angelobacter sp.]